MRKNGTERLEVKSRVANRESGDGPEFRTLAVPVGGAGVGHGVAVVAVGGDLVDEGALAAVAVLDGEARGLAHGQNVHTVDLKGEKKVYSCRIVSGMDDLKLLVAIM